MFHVAVTAWSPLERGPLSTVQPARGACSHRGSLHNINQTGYHLGRGRIKILERCGSQQAVMGLARLFPGARPWGSVRAADLGPRTVAPPGLCRMQERPG